MTRKLFTPILFSTLLASATLAADPESRPAKIKIPVNKETTYFTQPLREDGTVDYIKAVDAELSKGFKREQNAFFAFLPVVGVSDENLNPKYKAYLIKEFGLKETKPLWIEYTDGAKNDPARQKEYEAFIELCKKPWTKNEFPKFADYLASVDEPLAIVADATKLEHYAIPLWSKSDNYSDVLLPNLGHYRDIANVLATRASFRLGKGDIEGCQRDIMTLHRLGRLVTQGGSTIEYLVGIAIEAKAAQAATTMATSGKLSAKTANDYIQSLSTLELRPVYDSVNIGERCQALDYLARLTRKRDPEKNIAAAEGDEEGIPFTDEDLARVDFPAIAKRVNGIFDDLVAAMRTQNFAQQAAAIAKVEKKIDVEREFKFKRPLANDQVTPAVSAWVVITVVPKLGRAAIIERRVRVLTELAVVGTALAAYKADNKNYPEKLEALTPKYLAKIPTDPFPDKPLIYKPNEKGYLLYSISDDLTDDGGVPFKSNKGDFVVRADQ